MFWAGLLLFVVVGGELGALGLGASGLGSGDGVRVAQFVIGINLVPWTAIGAAALVHAGRRRRAGLTAKGPLSPALARVEDARATGDGPDHTVKLDLTVAPKGRPGYRVHTSARVNVMDLAAFRTGRTLDVRYDPERPWRVEVPGRPGGGVQVPLDGAPETSRVSEPAAPAGGAAAATLVAMALGAAAYLAVWGG